jgi:transmembrane sensor
VSQSREIMRHIDAHLAAVRMSDRGDMRIVEELERVRRRRMPPRRGAIAAFGLAMGLLVAIVIAVVLRIGGAHGIPRIGTIAEAASGIAAPSDDCARRVGAHAIELTGHCRTAFEHPRVIVETWSAAVIEREADALRLRSGWATFDVARAEPDAPVRVLVSAGAIEVLGTRFTVLEGDAGGHVDLIEGHIRFVDHHGGVADIEPGRRLAWTDAGSVVAAPHEHPAPPGSDSATPSDPNPDAPEATRRRAVVASRPSAMDTETPVAKVPLDRIARLRAAGRYAEAVAVIDAVEADRLDPRTAEALSYERGTILQDHLERTADACAHWRAHSRRFGAGRYRESVAARIEALGCDGLAP